MGGVSAESTILKLPLRELPLTLGPDCAICLMDGPGCDEYDLSNVWKSGCATYGYNRAFQQGPIENFVVYHEICLIDFLHNHPHRAKVRAQAELRSVWEKHADKELHSFEAITTSSIPTCVAYEDGYRKIYTIGEDGYFTTRGRQRRLRHSQRLRYNREIQATIPNDDKAVLEITRVDHFATMNRAGIAWNLRSRYPDAKIINLNPFSWVGLIHETPSSILNAPFGRIDRFGEAIVFVIEPYTSTEVTSNNYHPCFDVGRPVEDYAGVIRNLRLMHPNLPIFVRSAWKVVELKFWLEPHDILVGPLDAQVEMGTFEHVREFHLPPME